MRFLQLSLISILLVACAGEPSKAPVEARRGETKPVASKPIEHTVMGGDTLYAIAWRYGMDYRKLAGINGIARPYTIYPGQQLRLSGRVATTAPGSTSSRSTASSKTAAVTKPPASTRSKTVPAPAPPMPPMGSSAWQWPASGKVVRKFSGTVHKGIDISGSAGDPVAATAAGKVVYAGNGIVGYGNLLIVKHDEVYLSAYGHNRRLLVKEGEKVKAGQRIAEKGSSATNSVKLHFEIRREGKPVDPKRLLPAR